MLKELELAIQKGQYPVNVQDHQEVNKYVRDIPPNFTTNDKHVAVYIVPDLSGVEPAWALVDAAAGIASRGITLGPAVSGQPIDVLIYGFVTNSDWSFSVSDVLYLSESTNGVTNVAPVAPGSIVQVVGYAIGEHTAFLDFNSTFVTLA